MSCRSFNSDGQPYATTCNRKRNAASLNQPPVRKQIGQLVLSALLVNHLRRHEEGCGGRLPGAECRLPTSAGGRPPNSALGRRHRSARLRRGRARRFREVIEYLALHALDLGPVAAGYEGPFLGTAADP